MARKGSFGMIELALLCILIKKRDKLLASDTYPCCCCRCTMQNEQLRSRLKRLCEQMFPDGSFLWFFPLPDDRLRSRWRKMCLTHPFFGKSSPQQPDRHSHSLSHSHHRNLVYSYALVSLHEHQTWTHRLRRRQNGRSQCLLKRSEVKKQSHRRTTNCTRSLAFDQQEGALNRSIDHPESVLTGDPFFTSIFSSPFSSGHSDRDRITREINLHHFEPKFSLLIESESQIRTCIPPAAAHYSELMAKIDRLAVQVDSLREKLDRSPMLNMPIHLSTKQWMTRCRCWWWWVTGQAELWTLSLLLKKRVLYRLYCSAPDIHEEKVAFTPVQRYRAKVWPIVGAWLSCMRRTNQERSHAHFLPPANQGRGRGLFRPIRSISSIPVGYSTQLLHENSRRSPASLFACFLHSCFWSSVFTLFIYFLKHQVFTIQTHLQAGNMQCTTHCGMNSGWTAINTRKSGKLSETLDSDVCMDGTISYSDVADVNMSEDLAAADNKNSTCLPTWSYDLQVSINIYSSHLFLALRYIAIDMRTGENREQTHVSRNLHLNWNEVGGFHSLIGFPWISLHREEMSDQVLAGCVWKDNVCMSRGLRVLWGCGYAEANCILTDLMANSIFPSFTFFLLMGSCFCWCFAFFTRITIMSILLLVPLWALNKQQPEKKRFS